MLELLHASPSILFPGVGQRQLLELAGGPTGSDPKPHTQAAAYSRVTLRDARSQGGEERSRVPPTLACQLLPINPEPRLLEEAFFLIGHCPEEFVSIWSA